MVRMKQSTEQLLTKECFGLNDYFLLNEGTSSVDNSRGIYVAQNLKEKINMPIYRYMKYEHLVQLIMEKKLFVSNRQKFTDLRECSEYSFKSMDEIKYTISECPSYNNRKRYKEREERHSQIWRQPVSCWTFDSHGEKLNENYLMWRSYMGNGFVCRIGSSIKKIAENIKELTNDIIISAVEYVPIPRFHLANTPSDIFKKPLPYIGEQEIRFVVLHNDIESCWKNDYLFIAVNPTTLIDEIMLSPFVGYEEEQIMMKRLLQIMGESSIPIKRSILMECI